MTVNHWHVCKYMYAAFKDGRDTTILCEGPGQLGMANEAEPGMPPNCHFAGHEITVSRMTSSRHLQLDGCEISTAHSISRAVR